MAAEDNHDKTHYVYLCKKRLDADLVCKTHWDAVSAQLHKEEEDEEEARYSPSPPSSFRLLKQSPSYVPIISSHSNPQTEKKP